MPLAPTGAHAEGFAATLTRAREADDHEDVERALHEYETALCEVGREIPVREIAFALRRIATIHWLRGAYDAATDVLEVYAEVGALCHLEEDRAYAGLIRGTLHYLRGDYDRAEPVLVEARRTAESLRDDSLAGKIDNLLGIIADVHGDTTQALLRWGSALASYQRAGADRPRVATLINIGAAHHVLGELDAALAREDEAIELAKRTGYLQSIATAEYRRALIFVDRKELEPGRSAAERSLQSATAFGSPDFVLDAYRALGLVEQLAGDLESAERYLVTALALARQLGNPLSEAQVETNLAALCAATGRTGEGLQHIYHAQGLCRQMRLRHAPLAQLEILQARYQEQVRAWQFRIEAQAPHLAGHCDRVALLCRRIGAAMGLPANELRWLELGARLHDVGYLMLPAPLLGSTRTFSAVERAVAQLHLVLGDNLIARWGLPDSLRTVIRSHHERWDGTGYPDGLAGVEIPLAARITAIAERWDAMMTRRGERGALSTAEAIDRLREEAGGAFDPDLVELTIELLQTGADTGLEGAVSAAGETPSPEPSGQDDLRHRVQEALGSMYWLEPDVPSGFRGGMSRLFLATDTILRRRVVVKVLPPELHSDDTARRFHREMTLMARLQHPNVLPVLHAGQRGGLMYYITPFIEGTTLRQRLRAAEPLPLSEVLRVLRDIVAALRAAHRHGIVHRDLKPENILLNGGHALLADFGIARALPGAAGVTTSLVTNAGTLVGTPGYMAPEQMFAESEVGPPADVYALGVIAYELLAGEPPFTGGTYNEIMMAHLIEEPLPLHQRREDLPAGICRVIARCLEKNASDRFPDGAALADALDSLGPQG